VILITPDGDNSRIGQVRHPELLSQYEPGIQPADSTDLQGFELSPLYYRKDTNSLQTYKYVSSFDIISGRSDNRHQGPLGSPVRNIQTNIFLLFP
jgi:hypothetical protein